MREAARSLKTPDHLGLAYTSWAPTESDGKVPDSKRPQWLRELAHIRVSADYAHAFARWRSTFKADGDRVREVELVSRLLVGHGNASAADVGLAVHHTWGVPVIPGSALKGLLGHYVDALYGPESPDLPPWHQPESEAERVPYQGPVWRGSRIQRGPGDVYRSLFGAPDADEDREMRERGLGAGTAAGSVIFHDALYVPGSAKDERPYEVDVITVHQRSYYNSSGRDGWPNDYDLPNPVGFLTVRCGVRMLLALSGPPRWTELAERLLVDALREWGAGAKTSAGYGRFAPPEEVSSAKGPAPTPAGSTPSPRHRVGDKVKVTRVETAPGKAKVKFRADDGFFGHFAGEDPPQASPGETIEAWIANVNPHAYTLTCRRPKERRR